MPRLLVTSCGLGDRFFQKVQLHATSKPFPHFVFLYSLLLGVLGYAQDNSASKKTSTEHLERGFVRGNHCYATAHRSGELLWNEQLVYAALKSGELQKTVTFPGPILPPNQFRLAYDKLWIIRRSDLPHRSYWGFEFSDLLHGKLRTGKKAEDGYSDSFPDEGTLMQLSFVQEWNPTEIHYDFLPVGSESAKLFLLLDRPYSAHPEKNKHQKTPARKWTFTSAKFQAGWGPNTSRVGKNWKEGWEKGKWSDEEVFDVAFREPFHVYGLDKDYYFVTQTGKVYHSPPLEAGDKGPRKVLPFWIDRKQPVTHLVTHVDGKTANLTYVFGNVLEPEKQKQRDKFCFKLQGAKAELGYFSKAQLHPAKLEEPLKSLLEYSRLILYGPQLEPPVSKGPPKTDNALPALGSDPAGPKPLLIAAALVGALAVLAAAILAWRWRLSNTSALS